MDTGNQYSEILESLGGTKLNIRASVDRSLMNEASIDNNIKLVEQSFNSPVPNAYLSFIKEIGAITFNDPVKIQCIEKTPVANKENQVGVDNFFDFFDDDASITKTLDAFKGNIPNYVLPVCEGEAGDLIVIDMSKKNYGKVYYWHHEHMDETEGLYLIANNFNQFLDNLFKDFEDDSSADDVSVSRVSDKFLQRLKNSGKG